MSEYLITERRFLIVEDNPINREIATTILMHHGAFVEIVSEGRFALKKIKQHELGYYDVILMDINLPHMSGYEVADEIRKIKGCEKDKLQIIALSSDKIDLNKSKSLNGYCRKPLTINELISVLK